MKDRHSLQLSAPTLTASVTRQSDRNCQLESHQLLRSLASNRSQSPPVDVADLLRALPSETAVREDLARRRLHHYADYVHRKTASRHQRIICEHLEAVARGEITRLVIETPPRHGKTVFTSIAFPGWYIGNHPRHSVVMASYGQRLADKNSGALRNTIERNKRWKGIFPHVVIDPQGGRAKDEWYVTELIEGQFVEGELNEDPACKSVGVEAGLTGFGFNVLVIDDPLKDWQQAQSEVIKENIWEWYQSVAFTRQQPGANAAIIIMATRWALDDLTGRVLEQNDEGWKILRLPALAQANDPMGRAPGEALWEEQVSKKWLLNAQKSMSPLMWEALYQQNPIAASGNWFKSHWFTKDREGLRFWTLEDALTQPIKEAYFAWDTAAKTKNHNDFTAGGLGLLSANNHLYLLPVFLDRKEVPDVERIIFTQWAQWWLLLNQICPGALKGAYVEEGASGGTAIVQHAARVAPHRMRVAEALRYHLQSGQSEADFDWRPPIEWEDYLEDWKLVVRAAPIILRPHQPDRVQTAEKAKGIMSYCESQAVRLVDDPLCNAARPWLAQLLALPLGDHDDAVDVTVKLCRAYAGILEQKGAQQLWTEWDMEQAIMPEPCP